MGVEFPPWEADHLSPSKPFGTDTSTEADSGVGRVGAGTP